MMGCGILEYWNAGSANMGVLAFEIAGMCVV